MLVQLRLPQPMNGVNDVKNFWRSYSFVLTVVFLLSVSFVSVSAAAGDFSQGPVKMQFRNGMLGQMVGSNWQALNNTPLETALNFGATLAASGGGGMTLNEFSGYFGTWSDQKLNQLFKDYFYYRPVFDQYLDADGQIKTLVSTSGMPDEFYLSSLVSLGLRGLRSVMLDNASANHLDLTSGFAANHKDLDALLSKLTAVNTNVISFKNMNHTDLTSGFSTNHTDLTGFKSQAHSDAIAIEGVLESFKPELLFTLPSGRYLDSNGWSVSGTNVPAYTYLTQGFLGVAAKIDSNFSNWTTQFQGEPSFWAQGNLWNSSSGEAYSETYGYFVWMLSDLMSLQQSDLAKLRYVLASDQDIEISKKNEPVKDAIEDNFVGDAPGAVKPDSVGDMAGISGGLQDSLNTGANAGDVLGFLNGSEGWGFWSQEVANDLRRVSASVSDDEVSIHYKDVASLDDLSGVDFIHFYDPSALDDYLSRGDVS